MLVFIQHGFENGKSTMTNLLEYLNAVYGGVAKSIQVDSIYTDFLKSFDKVNHCLLFMKLKKIGGLLDWLGQVESYLNGRTQFVKVGADLSRPITVTSRVPQGSHLSPVLFLLFNNDLCGEFACNFFLYADDLKLFRCVDSINDSALLQSDLDRLVGWLSCNHMTLNAGKCEYISFSRKFVFSTVGSTYTIDGVRLITDCRISHKLTLF